MTAIVRVRRYAAPYVTSATNCVRQLRASLEQPSAASTAYVWLIMGAAALTLGHGIRSLQNTTTSMVFVYAAFFAAIEHFGPRIGTLRGLGSMLLLMASLHLTLFDALLLSLGWHGIQYLHRRQHSAHPLIVKCANSIVAVEIVSVLFHASWLEGMAGVKGMAAALCYFLMTDLSIHVVRSFEEHKWTEWQHHVTLRYWLLQAALVGLMSELILALGEWGAVIAIPGALLLTRWFHAAHTANHGEEMAALHLRTIEALALAIEAKDHTTHDHLRRVQVYATEIGKELKLSSGELEALRAAALLHDIGKLAVPEHIISKPGKLTREEFEKMKIHPTVGAEILERVEFPYPVAPIVAAHHEHWDGAGYPLGLRGEQIPIGARILSAVDCFDALATDRQYRRALPLEGAMKVLVAESGKSFDPQVIAVLQRRYVELEEMARDEAGVTLSTDKIIRRGAAPAAGFEVTSDPAPALRSHRVDFLSAMASVQQESQALFELSRASGKSLTLPDIASLMAPRIKTAIPFDGLAIYLKKERWLEPAFVTGDDNRLFSSLRIPMGEGLSGWVAENRKPIINGNPSVEPGYLSNPTIVSMLQSALAVPLDGADGVIGVLTLYQVAKDAYTADHLRLLQAIGAKLSLIIQNDSLQNETLSATTDTMTGLPNARALFPHLQAEVSRCLGTETSLVVLAFDLDNFSRINERLGYETGNRVLELVASALRKFFRDGYVARLGGDEFIVILPGITPDDADAIVGRLCAAVCEIGWSICRGDLLRISIGKAVLPTEGCAPEFLLAEAEKQLYQLKRHRKNSEAGSATKPYAPDDGLCTLESRPSISLQLGYAASLTDKTG